MAINFKSVWEGLKIRAKAVLTSDEVGEIEVSSVDNKTYLHNGSTRSPVVTEAHPATLTYKTIDANGTGNSISNLETADLAAGVLNTSTTLAAASDTQVPSALAVKTYVDNGLAAQNQASEITYDNTTSGLAATNVQAAIDEVEGRLQTAETGISNHISDAVDAHDASAISFVPVGAVVATDVQSAIAEVDADLTAHIGDTIDAHDASAISVVPTGNLAASDAQSAFNELQSNVDALYIDQNATDTALNNHITDTVDAHDASAISSIPAGNLAATDVQSALNELDTEKAKTNGDLANSFSVLRTEVATATDAATTGTNASLAAFTQGIIRLTNGSLVSLANIPAGNSGQQLEIVNRTGNQISIVDSASAVGTAANRILTGAAADINLAVDASLLLEYDATSARWQIIGGSGSGSGIATSAIDDNFAIVDASDATKQLTFNVSGTTGTATTIFTNQTANRLITIPDATDTVVVETLAQTLTNKTLSGASIQSPTRLDPKKDTEANLITYAATAQDGELCFSTDSEEFFQVKNGQLIPVIVPNDNELTNSGFQSTPVTYGWTISNATASANTANPFKGTQSLSLALTGALSLSQSSTINAAQKSGVQMVASIWVKSDDVSDIQLCSLKNGSEDKCTVTGGYVQGSGWRQLTVSFLGDSTSNGLKLKSTDTTGTVLVDQAFVGIGSPIVDFTPDMVYSAKLLQSSGAVSSENTDFISSCTSGVNPMVCTFVTNTFSVAPNCAAAPNYANVVVTAINAISATSVSIGFYSATTGAALTNGEGVIVCQKQGADYKTSKAYVASGSVALNTTEYSALISSTGTVTSSNVSGWTTGATFAGGEWTINFGSGYFPSVSPACVVTPSRNGSDAGVRIYNETTTSAKIAIYIAGAATQSAFHIVCQKQGADYQAAFNPVIVGSFQGYNETPGTSRVETFSVSYGTTNATTVCSASPCSYLDQIGSNVTSITRGGAGSYTLNLTKTYSKLKCTYSGDGSAGYVAQGLGLSCSNCSAMPFNTRTAQTNTVNDAYGNLVCQGIPQ